MRDKTIVWVSPLILDVHIHKTSRIEMLQSLARHNNKVFLIGSYSRKKPIETSLIRTISIPLRQMPAFSASAYALLLTLYLPLLFLKLKPDIVIVEPNPTVLSLCTTFFLPRSRRPKIVLDIRSTPVVIVGVGGYMKNAFFSISLKIAKRFFQGITIITLSMKKDVCKRFNVNPRSVGIWTSGVSTTAFNVKNYSKKDMQKILGLENRFVVFYHGAFAKNRGITETIQAVDLLRNKCPDLVLFLLGNVPTSVKSLISKLNLQKMVIAHDVVPYSEVPRFISLCDVGIVPLPDEPDWRYQCPLNLLEYLSMKKVVIATDIPANRDVLGECRCGIYTSSTNPKGIAKAIEYASENRKLLEDWGIYGRMLMEEKYSWMKVAEDFEDYLSLL
ncbi:MAG: glycosyltransferase [Candidatus Bathyarchaeota archaeon]|nr:glycosyltransferase [Candidatus Bathyarchaeota archaeon]